MPKGTQMDSETRKPLSKLIVIDIGKLRIIMAMIIFLKILKGSELFARIPWYNPPQTIKTEE